MKQLSFTGAEQAAKNRRTRREKFLAEMERLVTWARLEAVIEPLYPTSGRIGRQPIGVANMLRLYCLQQRYALADEALEDALYDMPVLRELVGIDLSHETVPDATTLLKFRRLLTEHDLTRALFDEINAHLAGCGLLMRVGTIVDAAIITAPPSTKNQDKARDPDMHQTKKGQQCHFGMTSPKGEGQRIALVRAADAGPGPHKAHIGVDADSGLVHTVIATAANVNDVTQANALLHGCETDAFGDAGYQGAHKRDDAKPVRWHVAMRPGKRRQLDKSSPQGRLLDEIERVKASVRAKVEHPFHVIKNLFGHRKARYKGLAKNSAQLTACSRWRTWCWLEGGCSRLTPKVRLEDAQQPQARLRTHGPERDRRETRLARQRWLGIPPVQRLAGSLISASLNIRITHGKYNDRPSLK